MPSSSSADAAGQQSFVGLMLFTRPSGGDEAGGGYVKHKGSDNEVPSGGLFQQSRETVGQKKEPRRS